MDIEHFGLLSSVIRKTESHEQDGETLRATARLKAASGDPAMALLFLLGWHGRTFPSGLLCAVHKPPTCGRSPPTTRAAKPRTELLQRRMPSLSISVL